MYIFCNKIEYVDHREMIFPVADLVPDICEGLSVRDIRATACVSRDVHAVIAPFMEERISEDIESMVTCRIMHYKSIWPRLNRVIKREISIYSNSFQINVSRLTPDYTGTLTIISGVSLYRRYNKSYIRVRNGLARYCINTYEYVGDTRIYDYYVYVIDRPIEFVRFINMSILYILHGDPGNGYIAHALIWKIHELMNRYGYINVREFIASEHFMNVLNSDELADISVYMCTNMISLY